MGIGDLAFSAPAVHRYETGQMVLDLKWNKATKYETIISATISTYISFDKEVVALKRQNPFELFKIIKWRTVKLP